MEYNSEISKLQKLINLSIQLSSERNLEKLISLIIQNAIDLLRAERSTILLLDKEKNELYSFVGVGLKKQEIRFPIYKGIAGEVVRTGKVLLINDPYQNSLFNPEIDQQTGFITRNILSVPLKNYTGETIGVFQVLNKISGNFDQQDENYALAFASIAAVAIENAQLIEQHKKQIEQLEKAYKELKEAQETLIRQEKFAILGRLAAGISHEIKNQLSVVMAVEAIKKILPENPKVQLYTDLIIEARNRIVNMLDELRDFSKRKEYEKSNIDLIALIKNTISICQFDKDLEKMKLVFSQKDNEPAIVNANPDKIQQVLINLLRNAAHASESKSKIEISLELKNDKWVISVRDYGSGIPEEIQSKIWEPFFTTKASGTGLGLDICKKIIENHDGKIWFESQPGVGTTFYIELPSVKVDA